jgi:Flp pilus assembly pilin Flp
MGRFAARRPWVVLGVWLLVSVTVIGTAGTNVQGIFTRIGTALAAPAA